jgi:hypothetical protein
VGHARGHTTLPGGTVRALCDPDCRRSRSPAPVVRGRRWGSAAPVRHRVRANSEDSSSRHPFSCLLSGVRRDCLRRRRRRALAGSACSKGAPVLAVGDDRLEVVPAAAGVVQLSEVIPVKRVRASGLRRGPLEGPSLPPAPAICSQGRLRTRPSGAFSNRVHSHHVLSRHKAQTWRNST